MNWRARRERRAAPRAPGEKPDLPVVQRVAGVFGGDEMAHHQVDALLSVPSERVVQRAGGVETEPAHAGVDMQRDRHGARRKRAPTREFRLRPDRRNEPVGAIVADRVGVRLQAVEHDDAGVAVRQRPAQNRALRRLGDEEISASGAIQRRSGVRGADSIGVRLHHRAAGRRRHPLREQAPIGGERAEVDRQQARVGHETASSQPVAKPSIDTRFFRF